MRKSCIKLIYKYDLDEHRIYPKNYRPIALLNVIYKIFSKLLADKMKLELANIISIDQFCMPKRYIGDLIMFIQTLINNPDNSDMHRFLALLDFEKAFDSVNHEFTFKAMEAFGIPAEFIKLTRLGFHQTSACCIINGKHTKYFDLPGGGRQGDNLYPLIFAIVMQVLNASIKMQNMCGINIHDQLQITLKQYADDSTACGSGREDYVKLRIGVKNFELASGMQVNWTKSIMMFWGNEFDLLENDQIKVLANGEQVRVLGIMMGHKIDPNVAYNKLNTKVRSALSNKTRSVDCVILDTVTVNAVAIGSCVFNLSFQSIKREQMKKLEVLFNCFIRKDCYMLSEQKRLSSVKDGQIVSKISLPDLNTTLKAKWMYKILCSDKWEAYAYLMIKEMIIIAKEYGWYSITQLLNSSIELDRGFTKIATFTHECMRAFQMMGYRMKHIETWESIMGQNIFHNRMIINPDTNKPYDKAEAPFNNIGCIAGIKSGGMNFLHSLTNFNSTRYRKNPEIPAGSIEFLTPAQLNKIQ